VKYFRSISLFSVVALSGCGEPSYEQCIRDAVKDGKTEFGIRILYNLCDEAKTKRLEARDKKCFAELTEKFGEPAVQQYEYMLGGPVGLCDPSVDVPSWITKPENEAMSTEAAEAAVEGAEVAQ
jgi:hypothetical protein